MESRLYIVMTAISALALTTVQGADLSNGGNSTPSSATAIAQNLSTENIGNRELSWRSATIHSQNGQSFVATKDGVAESISLFLTSPEDFASAYASPVTFKLKVFSGATAATAVELGSYSYDAKTLGDGLDDVWLEFGLGSGISMTNGSTYSFILTFASLDADHRLNFQRNTSNDRYTGGDELRPASSANDYDAANFDTDPWDTDAPQGAGGEVVAIANADMRFSVNELITENLPPVVDDISKTTILTNAVDFTLTGSDANGDPLTFTVHSPTNGTLSGTSPDLTYSADPGFSGTDIFTYFASDGETNSELGTVTITVLAGSGMMSNVGTNVPSGLIGGDDAVTSRSREFIRSDSQTFVVGQSFTLSASTNVTEIYLKSASTEDFGTYTGSVEIKIFSGVGASATLEHVSIFNGAANDQGDGNEVVNNDWVRFVLQDSGVVLPEGENSFLVHWSEKGAGNKWGLRRSDTGIYGGGKQYEYITQSGDAYPQWDTDPWALIAADDNDDLCFFINTGATTVTPSELYATWAGANGANVADMLDDTDLDGMSELLEYALGGDPTTNDVATIMPVATADGGWMYYVYNRRYDAVDRGLIYDVFSSIDLVHGQITNVTEFVDASPVVDGFESVTNRISTTVEGSQFMKLKVELAD
ncbi:Ig-like domain-containing protein [Pontiellaceae bacterium B12227]|nr:Ig-like domain-containing protein [Pontiellaceae bacterium B12227]